MSRLAAFARIIPFIPQAFSMAIVVLLAARGAQAADVAAKTSVSEGSSDRDAQQVSCTKNCDCEIRVGLEGALKTYSSIADLSETACKESCKSTSDHWDQRNLSTVCLYRGKTFATDTVGLLDMNWASCDITNDSNPIKPEADKRRTSRRVCVRECADRVKAHPEQKKSIRCDWDASRLSDEEVAKSRGLLP